MPNCKFGTPDFLKYQNEIEHILQTHIFKWHNSRQFYCSVNF